jgi:large subunit ribosomal protein L13
MNITHNPKAEDTSASSKPWYVLNADGQILGRLASLAATIIRGKMSPQYQPAMKLGSYVIVINAEKVKVTGKKYTNKYYFRHTQNKRSGAGRIGGYRLEYFNEMQKRLPERIVEKAVFGMLPKGRLGKDIRVKQLKVFRGVAHPYVAQKPLEITHLISSNSRAINS